MQGWNGTRLAGALLALLAGPAAARACGQAAQGQGGWQWPVPSPAAPAPAQQPSYGQQGTPSYGSGSLSNGYGMALQPSSQQGGTYQGAGGGAAYANFPGLVGLSPAQRQAAQQQGASTDGKPAGDAKDATPDWKRMSLAEPRPTAPPARGTRLRGPGRALGGDRLSVGGHVVRLRDVSAPALPAVCRSGATVWACGVDAREALQRLADAGPLLCVVTGVGPEPEAACAAGRDTLARGILLEGYATTTEPSLTQAMAEAQHDGRGIWARSAASGGR
jgi:endonuclease YncB( thermonuclease family)